MRTNFQQWVASGSPWIWMTAGGVSLSLVMVFGLLFLIAANGLGYFWPGKVAAITVQGSADTQEVLLGEIADRETVSATRVRESGAKVPAGIDTVERFLIKVGNRDMGHPDFRWVAETEIKKIEYPPGVIVAERTEWGNFYGFLSELRDGGRPLPGASLAAKITQCMARSDALKAEIKQLERIDVGHINAGLERLRLRTRALGKIEASTARDEIAAKRESLEAEFAVLSDRLTRLRKDAQRDTLVLETSSGQFKDIPFDHLVRVFHPNAMSWAEKVVHYVQKVHEFTTDEPREANTEGGVFPAIFGTVLMVMVMSIMVTPFGVIAAIYLREYAAPGLLTSAIRIAVNNLAGVPSVVFGVFGFGFFVYFLGGSVDRLFFAAKLPAPTFGTPGLLWSAITLALLTVPVVIVSTEEGLARIPRAIREGSLALGATKAETLWRTIIPMATPAIMTGLILAIARAAGEVAPLMMVGVVKLAPSLPLDGEFPFFHLDRKFMHLGFHIYDVGFQSPNVEAARPIVYATAFLLVVIIVALNLTAVQIRNRLREKYHAADH